MSEGATRARAGNLTAALVAVAFLELVLNRLANRLFLPRSTISGETIGSPAARVLSDSGPFLFNLTGVLALLVLSVAFVGLLRRGELFPRPMRFSVIIIGLVFWTLAAGVVLLGLRQARFFVYLEISYAFLSLLIAASLLGTAASGRVKLGVGLFTLPGVLNVLAIVSERSGPLSTMVSAVEVTRMGELLLLGAGLAAPFLLVPRPVPARAWRLPLAVAATLTIALGVVLAARYDLAQATALYGLRLEIPHLGSAFGVAYLLAFYGWATATLRLLTKRGGTRLAGYGLLLLAIAGYQAASPVELGLALVGLLALSVGELRAAGDAAEPRGRVGRNEWRAYVGRLATAVGDGTSPEDLPPEAVVVEEGDVEVSRIRAHRRGRPVAIRLLRRRAALVELDATVGQPARGGPDASIERHRRWLARSPADRVSLPRVKTGDAVFDQRFSVHGEAPLADADLRRRLARQQGDGVVSVWSGSAARYLLASPATPQEAPPAFAGKIDGDEAVGAVVDIVDTLGDLIEASTPSTA